MKLVNVIVFIIAIIAVLSCKEWKDTDQKAIDFKDKQGENEKPNINSSYEEKNSKQNLSESSDSKTVLYLEVQNSELDYFEDLKKWLDVFYDSMIRFSDEELRDMEFAKAGANFLDLKFMYLELKESLKIIKERYYKNVTEPENNVPENIRIGLMLADQYFRIAMQHRIDSLHNIIASIEILEEREARGGENYTDENLIKYQENIQSYNKFSAKMINQIQEIMSKINLQFRFRDGKIVELHK